MDLIVDFPQASPPNEKRVSFVDTTEINFVENLSHKHKDDLWYCGHEMDSFKDRVAFKLRAVKAKGMTVYQYAERNHEDTSAFMGLESYFTDATSQKARRLDPRLLR